MNVCDEPKGGGVVGTPAIPLPTIPTILPSAMIRSALRMQFLTSPGARATESWYMPPALNTGRWSGQKQHKDTWEGSSPATRTSCARRLCPWGASTSRPHPVQMGWGRGHKPA